MAAPDSTFRRRPDVAARRGDRAANALPRVTGLLVWTVLTAVVVGLAVGALACSAALAGGSGHLVHAQASTTLVAPASQFHDGHGAVHFVADGAEPPSGSDGVGHDTRSGPAGTGGQGHPGMACVVTVDLDMAELVTPVVTAWFDGPRAAPLAECVGEVDPPVPRLS